MALSTMMARGGWRRMRALSLKDRVKGEISMPDEIELAQQRHDARECSPEGVLSRLNLYPFVDDPDLQQVIVPTVLCLPDEVLEIVCAQYTFVWFGRKALGHTAPVRYFSRPGVIHHRRS
jgi:hypothetical protein